ncbi:MAG: hypothetical protein AABW48_06040 [Nanoarchaeota archaeon]
MIDRKEISLWLINSSDGLPIKKTLASLDLNNATKPEIDTQLLKEFWYPQKFGYSIDNFCNIFLNTKNFFQSLLIEIVQKQIQFNPYYKIKTTDLYKELLTTELSFATAEAFSCKTTAGFRKDKEDEETKDQPAIAAYYSPLEGVVLAAQHNTRISTTDYLLTHEYGHCLDYLLNPTEYTNRSATMAEVMALLVQYQRGFKINYSRGPHKRAQEILSTLNQTEFAKLDFANKWLSLKNFIDHQYIFKHPDLQTP